MVIDFFLFSNENVRGYAGYGMEINLLLLFLFWMLNGNDDVDACTYSRSYLNDCGLICIPLRIIKNLRILCQKNFM